MKVSYKWLKQLVDLDDKNGSKYTLYKKVTYSLATVLAGVLLIFPMFLYSNNFLQNKRAEQLEDTNEILYIEEKDILPKVGTIENLNSLLSSLNEERLSENEDVLSEIQEYISKVCLLRFVPGMRSRMSDRRSCYEKWKISC